MEPHTRRHIILQSSVKQFPSFLGGRGVWKRRNSTADRATTSALALRKRLACIPCVILQANGCCNTVPPLKAQMADLLMPCPCNFCVLLPPEQQVPRNVLVRRLHAAVSGLPDAPTPRASVPPAAGPSGAAHSSRQDLEAGDDGRREGEDEGMQCGPFFSDGHSCGGSTAPRSRCYRRPLCRCRCQRLRGTPSCNALPRATRGCSSRGGAAPGHAGLATAP